MNKFKIKQLIKKSPLFFFVKFLPIYKKKQRKNKFIAEETKKLLSKHFSDLIIRSGMFKGMKYLPISICSTLLPKLVGTYEEPIVNLIQQLDWSKYDIIVDIGSAEGYYAVGFSRMFPKKKIIAYDIDVSARKSCIKLAKLNGVKNLQLRTECNFSEINSFSSKTFILCDIEGAERELLNPKKAKKLKEIDFIVECHDLFSKGISSILINRFKKTHSILVAYDYPQRKIPLEFQNLDVTEKRILTDERRGDPHMKWIKFEALKK